MRRDPELQPDSTVVSLRDVDRSFDGRAVLQGLSLDIPEGQTTVVMGPSGCGKSVTLKHMIGLLRPDKGEVWFRDHRIDNLRERELAPIRRRFGMLFQQAALFDSMTVRDNVAFPMKETGHRGTEVENKVRETLGLVGLADSMNQMPGELSGGMKKRVGLARALVLDPEVVLYDEPTTGLDPIRADVINEMILRMQKELTITSVVVTHDLVSAFKVADRMVLLHEGRVRAEGTPEEIRKSDDPVVTAFLEGRATDVEIVQNATSMEDPETRITT
ncbi:MAG: ABC transporter ATP-binding protein [Phycisphaerales bacterium]|nr:ABC transporter ATP-binding protein [Phycisphaerales bacterium]